VFEGTQNKVFSKKDDTNEGKNKVKIRIRIRFLGTTVNSSNSYYIILKLSTNKE
jgi:hypothetical protein